MGNEVKPIQNKVNLPEPKPLEQTPQKPQVPAPLIPSFRDSQTGDRFFHGNIFKQQIENKFLTTLNTPPAPPTPQENIEAALKTIRGKLDESGVFNDVTHGELQDIDKTLQNLTPEEANGVIAGLKPEELRKWADELNSGGIFGTGGFDAGEKKAMFEMLAGKLDGANLSKLATAMNTRGASGEENMRILGQAIAAKATPQAKAEFVRLTAGSVEKNEANALAVAEVLGSLKDNPTEFKAALGSLNEKQLTAVLKAATQEKLHSHAGFGGSSSLHTTFDPAPLARIIDAAANSGDAEVKARIFDAAGKQLKSIEEAGGLLNPVAGQKEDAAQVREAMTRLLNSDTTGIVTNLEQDNSGEGLKAYVKSMLATGSKADQEIVGAQISRLLTGNDNRESQVGRFETTAPGTTGKAYYQNARTLGFYAGAIYAGTKSITDDRAKQADIIKNVFDTAAGAIGAANPAAGVGAAAGKGLTMAVIDEVVSKMDDESYDLRNAMIDLTFPRDADGDLYRGPAKTDYEAAFAFTALRNDN